MNFRARTAHRQLALHVPLTFIPDAVEAGPRPAVPVGLTVPVALQAGSPDLDDVGYGATTLLIEAATRFAMVARLPDGRRLHMTPRRPTEPGSFWRPGLGMSEWVVREETPAS